ncbi:hypothetical protein CB1_002652002 [Camelus ferus]|nr:hypothetical protein CB1_002652002 [Camelus ferus]
MACCPPSSVSLHDSYNAVLRSRAQAESEISAAREKGREPGVQGGHVHEEGGERNAQVQPSHSPILHLTLSPDMPFPFPPFLGSSRFTLSQSLPRGGTSDFQLVLT